MERCHGFALAVNVSAVAVWAGEGQASARSQGEGEVHESTPEGYYAVTWNAEIGGEGGRAQGAGGTCGAQMESIAGRTGKEGGLEFPDCRWHTGRKV